MARPFRPWPWSCSSGDRSAADSNESLQGRGCARQAPFCARSRAARLPLEVERVAVGDFFRPPVRVGRWPIGDVRRRFQHFRCSTWEQVFGDARYRATRKALNEARAAYKAALAARADQATLRALKNAILEAERVKLVVNVTGPLG
jgi:hypothetical protein